jgi:prepilin-type processing-associated H-X9-DG protein
MIWYRRLIASGYAPAPAPGQPNIFLCPSQKPRCWSSASWNDQEHTYSYGQRSTPNSGTYSIGRASVVTSDSIDFGPPVGFVFIGDSVLNFPGDAGDRFQRYGFTPYNYGPYQNSVHLRHSQRGNFLFGDGHVLSLSKPDLLGNYYGSLTGTYGFDAIAIDETNGSF